MSKELNYVEIAMKKGFDILQKKMLVVPDRCCGIHMFSNKNISIPENRRLNLCMPLSATSNKELSLFANLPCPIVIKNEDEKQKFYELDFKMNDDAVEFCNIHLPMDRENGMIYHVFRYEDVIQNIARDLYYDFCKGYQQNYAKKHKPVEKMSASEFKQFEAEERVKNMAFLKFLKSFDAMEIVRPDDGKEPMFCEYKMEGFDVGVLYQTYQLALVKLPTQTAEQKEIRNKVYQQIDKAEKRLNRQEKEML